MEDSTKKKSVIWIKMKESRNEESNFDLVSKVENS